MNIPKLRKERTVKTYHDHELSDEYAYVDQPHNIIEVLQNPEKLLPEVRKYLEENNKLTDEYFSGESRHNHQQVHVRDKF